MHKLGNSINIEDRSMIRVSTRGINFGPVQSILGFNEDHCFLGLDTKFSSRATFSIGRVALFTHAGSATILEYWVSWIDFMEQTLLSRRLPPTRGIALCLASLHPTKCSLIMKKA